VDGLLDEAVLKPLGQQAGDERHRLKARQLPGLLARVHGADRTPRELRDQGSRCDVGSIRQNGEEMSDGLILRCGRCGDSMEWRVNDGKGMTELLIVPCRRCLDAAVGEEVVAKYAESLAVEREIDPCPGCGKDLRDAQLLKVAALPFPDGPDRCVASATIPSRGGGPRRGHEQNRKSRRGCSAAAR
jgi:hypothetical protein